jgi:hypothetical protein
MAWWEEPYPGGTMVPVKGFPRPLYPPEAGETASIDGPDVEAYKRTVSRAGRWTWQRFDQAYSSMFAYGRAGSEVTDSGIAGVQDQARKIGNGIVDRETFNLLRSIRIPAGLPHQGEMAMDAAAVELVNAAWQRFYGQEPVPGSTSSAAARLEQARREIGTSEYPAGSNNVEYADWYGAQGQPWCAMFCTWADQTGEAPSKSFLRGARYAYVPYIVSDARLAKNGLSLVSSPAAGDLVCFDWGYDGEYDHVGLVEQPPDAAGEFVTIEGNTSTSDNSNGGQVMRRQRNMFQQGTLFVRAREP